MAATQENLLIFGASARAAAGSALRAGLHPWCADLFADVDLCQRCPAMKLPGRYPDGFLQLIDVELPGPWIYTGGLENRVLLVQRMARRRPLWGNNRAALLVARHPGTVVQILRSADLPAPDVHWFGGNPDPAQRWLLKPLTGSGGLGIRHWQGEKPVGPAWPPRFYLQQFIEGTPWAAVFAGDGTKARFLGATRQLVGEPWLRAAPFQYCGSLGPIEPEPALLEQFAKLGDTLASEACLRGLFGVDGIVRDGSFWPVEVNPRYPASIEVLEHATGLQALAWHRRAFDASAPLPAGPAKSAAVIGKAILYARQPLIIPTATPWQSTIERRLPIEELPGFADVPRPGQPIDLGAPIVTFFARAATPDACAEQLQHIAGELDHCLFQ